MSLSLKFKKAYTKVFSGKENGWKDLMAVVTALSVPAVAGISFSNGGDYSDVRTAGLGDQQFTSMSAEIDTIAAKNRKLSQLVGELNGMTQQLVYNPADSTLRKNVDAKIAEQANSRKTLDREVTDFRNRLMLSQGISEVDAIKLVDMAESKTGYILSPNDSEFRQRFQYLDECQWSAQSKAMQSGASIDKHADLVRECQISEMGGREALSLVGGMVGIPVTSLFLFGMSRLGAAFRRQMPAQERREEQALVEKGPKPVKTTLTVTYTKDQK